MVAGGQRFRDGLECICRQSAGLAERCRSAWSQPLTTSADVPAAPGSPAAGTSSPSSNHEPTLNRAQMDEGGVAKTVTYDPIYLITLRGIEARCARSISAMPIHRHAGIEDALLRASRRGVKVRVHTNSMESVGDPILIRPILAALAP